MAGTLFKKVDYALSKLVEDIGLGEIGLPDIQRPFVWPNVKVRDLFDSMYKGFPVGYLLFWTNVVPEGFRQVGVGARQQVPRLLIVDGQQRLTSLYAVLTGTPVIREDYKPEPIQIAFRPVDGAFEVADAAIKRNPEFISDISQLWSPANPRAKFVRAFVARLREHREVSEDEEDHLAEIIDRVFDLRNYPFTALELSGSVPEEEVAEVFVRINSKGTPLNQADFILTLMSVFWDKGRKSMEDFCRASRQPALTGASPFNHFIKPDPDQLLRVTVALGFRRARLQYVYSLLRGKDLETGVFSDERREQQFAVLEEAQSYALDIQNWHEFFKAIMQAGYRRGDMITSNVGLLYAYAMFLVGKRDFHVDSHTLRKVLARWFFMTALTGRYTGSPEAVMDQDLARLREIESAEEFIGVLDSIVDATFTGDYWTTTLPLQLATSSSYSPQLFAYYAALNLLDARVLFSKLKVSELLDPATKAKKAAVERHHLFPKAYLASMGITGINRTNQIANYALVEWPDNASISAQAPAKYWPKFVSRYSAQELQPMLYWHALPPGWEEMEYQPFLSARQKLVARVIQDAFRLLRERSEVGTEEFERAELREANESRRLATMDLITAGESNSVEFKESARWSHIEGHKEKVSEQEIVRAVAGFLNARGGILLIGVTDTGDPVGLR